jgi:cell division protein FtsL
LVNNDMNNVTNLIKKYRQAPWRVQRQWLGLFLLGVITVAMVAAVYLNVTARAALAGREIQLLQVSIEEDQRINADLETKRAALTSAETMRKRAIELGFEPAEEEDIVYVTVDGYVPPPPVDLSVKTTQPAAPDILPEYKQSLLEWFAERLQASTFGGQP